MRIALIAVGCAAAVLAVACAPTGTEQAAAPPVQEGLANGSFLAELNGFDIHYEVHGQGPALMVVPNSWGLSLAGLRNLYRPLEEKLTLVYFEPRGMGESGPVVEASDMGLEAVRADLNALREHLGLGAVDAIGWSNGAGNLILLAAEQPETIDRAVFVHGSASFTAEDGQAMAARYPELMTKWGAFQQELAASPDLTDAERTEKMRALWLGDWFPTMVADQETAHDMIQALFADAQFSWAHADYSQRAYPTFDAREQLPLITARSLVIAGSHDMMPPERVRELADGITDAEFVVFESSGHFAPAEETERFTRVVWEFLGVE